MSPRRDTVDQISIRPQASNNLPAIDTLIGAKQTRFVRSAECIKLGRVRPLFWVRFMIKICRYKGYPS